MNSRSIFILVLLLMGIPSEKAHAVQYRNATIEKLQSTYADTNCFYFTLAGVTEADPAVPSAPWFAISRAAVGAADKYAMLLAAKISGSPLWVTTSGQLVCGYAAVGYIILE